MHRFFYKLTPLDSREEFVFSAVILCGQPFEAVQQQRDIILVADGVFAGVYLIQIQSEQLMPVECGDTDGVFEV